MKRIVARVILGCLLCWVGSSIAQADLIPTGPQAPERPESVQAARSRNAFPVYSVAAGVVAVALTGSLIALRRIRKNGGSPTDPNP
jgi:hypothetical protein